MSNKDEPAIPVSEMTTSETPIESYSKCMNCGKGWITRDMKPAEYVCVHCGKEIGASLVAQIQQQTDTPLTDAAATYTFNGFPHVDAAFARELEIKLAAAEKSLARRTNQRDWQYEQNIEQIEKMAALEKSRDAWREVAMKMHKGLLTGNDEVRELLRIEKERA